MLDEKVLQKILDDLENTNKKYFETGFTELDDIIKIGEKDGALITIGARPAMGKTTLMLSIMEKLLEKQKKVLFFSQDMCMEKLVERMWCMFSEISWAKTKTKNLNATDFEKLVKKLDDMTKYKVFIEDDSDISVEIIEEKIKEEKPEIVFIDYFQLLGGRPKQDRLTQIEENMKNLKRIAKENGIIIFIASQLSRAPENRYDKRPLISDLRESGANENISDIVILLYRDDYYNARDEDDELRLKGETEVIVAKNKFGPVGIVHIIFRANIPKFYPVVRSDKFDIF